MVTTLPASTTMRPAPADSLTSLTLMVKSLGAPRSSALSESERGVFATQMGSSA